MSAHGCCNMHLQFILHIICTVHSATNIWLYFLLKKSRDIQPNVPLMARYGCGSWVSAYFIYFVSVNRHCGSDNVSTSITLNPWSHIWVAFYILCRSSIFAFVWICKPCVMFVCSEVFPGFIVILINVATKVARIDPITKIASLPDIQFIQLRKYNDCNKWWTIKVIPSGAYIVE